MLTGQQLEFLCLGFGLVFVVEVRLSSRTRAPTSVVKNAHVEDVAQLNDNDLVSSRSYCPSSRLRLEDLSQNPRIGPSVNGLASHCFRCQGNVTALDIGLRWPLVKDYWPPTDQF